jgi:hypothetical protein
MPRRVSAFVSLLVLVPLAVLAQYGGRHGGSTNSAGKTTAPPDDPDLAGFKHAVAVQATEEQTAQFRLMTKSTETARQQAHELQHLGPNAGDSVSLTHKATALQSAVEEAQTQNRTLRQSLSDAQEAGLKTLTKKLAKADAAVSKGAKALSQQLEQGPINSEGLTNVAANLEKSLLTLQSDQLSLGKEMGVTSP